MIIRRASRDDTPELEQLIDASIRVLGGKFYNEQEIEESLVHVFGVDTTMIDDETYFVIQSESRIVGAGGWSHRKTPFGGDQAQPVRDAKYRSPGRDPAVIRAMFVHPDLARKGIGRLIIEHCEGEARKAGFQKFELVATLSGVSFYERMGYRKVNSLLYDMPIGSIKFVRMVNSS